MGRRFFIVLLCILGVYNALCAQEAGVYAGTKLSPPFSPYIQEYTDVLEGQLRVQLKNTGTTQWNVVLRMVLESSPGIRIETKPNSIPLVYVLTSGKELLLTGSMLKSYFEPGNLLFKGLSPANYIKYPLPAGLYKIRFDAYDAKNGKLLATGEATQVWLALNKAPAIVFPANNGDIYLGEGKHFYFEWLERHDKVAGLSDIEYEFQLVQVPNAFTGQVASIFHTLPVIFRQTGSLSSLLIDFTRNFFEEGRRYAFCVKAKAMSGKNEFKIFENDGYSSIFVFTYKGVCPIPVVTKINFPTIHTAEITWSQPPNVNRYTFLIRDAASKNWERKDLTQPYMRLSTLSYDKTYEYKLRGYCKVYPGAYSETYTLMLPPGEKPVMYHSSIRLTGSVEIRYNRTDTTVTISAAKDSIRVDVRETVKRNIPVSIADDEGNVFTLTPKRLK